MGPHMSGSLRGLRMFPALGHRRRGAHAHYVRWGSRRRGRLQATPKQGRGGPLIEVYPNTGALGDCSSAHHHSLLWANRLLSVLPVRQVKRHLG